MEQPSFLFGKTHLSVFCIFFIIIYLQHAPLHLVALHA